MNKKTVFYILQLIFALAILASAIAKLTQHPMLVEAFTQLGYPLYLLMILGVAYILGIIAILQPKCQRLQEWGYAGFAIALTGALMSHLLAGDPLEKMIPSLALLLLMTIVYTLRNKVNA
jgi:hypothetical protein